MTTPLLADPSVDADLEQLCQAYRRVMFLSPAPLAWNCRQQCAVEATCPIEEPGDE